MEKVKIPKQLKKQEFRFILLRRKDKRPMPEMKEWQKVNAPYDNPVLEFHLNGGGNYAIIGGYGNLILIDADSEEIDDICKSLPETFTVKTGSPESYKNHYYFITDNQMKGIRLSKEKVGDLGDIRSTGQYVVAPNSIHPSGNKYKVVKDIPIAKVSEQFIKSLFKNYIDPSEINKENKIYEPDLKLRNSRYIKECNVPDYCRKNKFKSETSKNWKLFPYLVDILHNRQALIPVYEEILKTQGHNTGAIKGWLKLAREGKLAKGSCKKMQEYLGRFHPELIETVCGECPLYQIQKKKKEIEINLNYSELQKEVLLLLLGKNKDEATELIVKEIEKNNYIYTTKDDLKSEMWIYQGGIYIPQGKSFIKEVCRKILDVAFTGHLANNVIDKIEADTYIDHDEFFKTNYPIEIPLENGVLNIITKELNSHSPNKIFFNKLPVEYNPAAECHNIVNHLKKVLKDEDDISVLLELFGYLLLKEYKIEKAFMFVGGGRNGKSKTIELMKRFLGVENCSSLPLRALNEESFSLSELFGKMANLSADLSKTDLKETGMIKALIGRDLVQAKRKFLRDLNFVNHAKMVFAANELPKIYDTTDGFWTKWVLIEFPYTFVSEKVFNTLKEEERKNCRILDPDIIKNLTTSEELSGLLNLALEHLDTLLKNRDFSYSKGTKEVKDMWIRKSDSFTAFCFDCVEEDFEGEVSKKELRTKYHEYRKKHKVSGCSEKAIKITLENMFGASEIQKWEGNRERYWEGISLVN